MAIIKKELGNRRGIIVKKFRCNYAASLDGLKYEAFRIGWKEAWEECTKQLQIELDKHRWIPVTERLPEESGWRETITNTRPEPISCYYSIETKSWETTRIITRWKPIILPKEETK